MYTSSPALAPVLYIPGMIYQAGVYLRNRAFDAGLISARGLSRPTVSVGNLSLGGTGKTPFVIYLSGLLGEMGYESAVLTRGYGRRNSGKTIVLPAGKNEGFPASCLGDEPALIRRRLPDAWLGISPDRFRAANAIARHNEYVKTNRLIFILDDGFQRRDIRRDLDVVMIDPAQPQTVNRLFPLGALREPAAELRRAHVVVINGSGSSAIAGTRGAGVEATAERLRKYAPGADFFYCVQKIQNIVPFSDWLDSGASPNLQPPPETAFLVAAIGNPGRFKRDVKNMGIEARGCAFFNDHAVIGKKDWDTCVKAARQAKSEAIIITEKDAVKISNPPDFPLFVAVQNTELRDEARFREILARALS